MIDARKLQLLFYSTELMIADALTKELAQEKFTAFINAMVLRDTKPSDLLAPAQTP
jgi:hypothetical protein